MRLAAFDTVVFYLGKMVPEVNDDIAFLVAVDSGAASPPFEDIKRVLAERAREIPALRELIAAAPGNRGFPHWVPDPIDPLERISEHAAVDDWPAALRAIAALANHHLDPCDSGWRITVFRDVRGVPSAPAAATLVLVQASHAITDGPGIVRIVRRLFGDASTPPPEGHGQTSPTVGWRQIAADHVRRPLEFVRRLGLARRALRIEPVAVPDATPALDPESHLIDAINGNSDGNRAFLDIRVVPKATLRAVGTVTETALFAVSTSLESYLAGRDIRPGTLHAQVPVVPKRELSPSRPSANSSTTGALVDLAAGAAERTERAQRIATSLQAELVKNSGFHHDLQRELLETQPIGVVRRFVDAFITALPKKFWGNTSVVSFAAGAADLSLLDGPVRFVSLVPITRPHLALTHGVFGLGDAVAVAISATEAIPDASEYADLLHTTLRQL